MFPTSQLLPPSEVHPLRRFNDLASSDEGALYRIMSIDPGSDTLGLTLLTVDLRNGTITIEYSSTFEASRMLRYLPPGYESTFGSMHSRMYCHQQMLVDMMGQFKPHAVIAESAFLKKRFPRAFEVLITGLEMIRGALRIYNPWMLLETVEPSAAKKAVGHKGNSKDKEGVHACVINYPGLIWHVDPLSLDEHSSDSVAIGISKASQIIEDYVCPVSG